MEIATDRSASPKRVRFDPTANPGTENQTPMALARDQIKTHIESLHTDLQPLLSKAAKDLLLALHNAHHKQQQVQKMETTEDYIPASAHLKFKITVSKDVEQAPEYIALRDETQDLVKKMQKELKSKIISVAKLEITFQQKNIATLLAIGIAKTVNGMLIISGKTSLDCHKIANTILQNN